MSNKTIINILRQKILSGEFAAGERLAEIPTAESLGVSRTPVRIAFRDLQQEGLLEKLPRRGYVVRQVTARDICNGVEVRGVLEGLAARQAAEIGLSSSQLALLKECLEQGDKIFERGVLSDIDIELYQKMNQRFHALIVDASANSAIANALNLNEHLPFASSNAIAYDPENLSREYERLSFAHKQHHFIVDAIENKQASRAEALMREHAYVTLNQVVTYNDESYQVAKG